MISNEANTITEVGLIKEKVRAFVALGKLRLASLVVFSAVVSYFFAAETIDWIKVFYLSMGGLLITASSNAFNQIIEKDLDKLMDRTQDRPLPKGKISVIEAIVFSIVTGVIGTLLLWIKLNPLSGLLGLLALIMYVGLYTPMKRISPFAVFIGAFPGAIPPLLGYIAYSGEFGLAPGLLFAIQFVWQFPHFWAIAWKCDADYAKAGFKLLPSQNGKDKFSAFQTLVYSLFLIPVSLTPYYFGMTGNVSAVVIAILGVWFAFYSVILFRTLGEKAALKLMFASFIYLPIVQLALLFDKI